MEDGVPNVVGVAGVVDGGGDLRMVGATPLDPTTTAAASRHKSALRSSASRWLMVRSPAPASVKGSRTPHGHEPACGVVRERAPPDDAGLSLGHSPCALSSLLGPVWSGPACQTQLPQVRHAHPWVPPSPVPVQRLGPPRAHTSSQQRIVINARCGARWGCRQWRQR